MRTARATGGSATDGAAAEPVASASARGTLTVGVGLVLLGVSASVFLVLSARAVGPHEFAAVSALWTFVYTFGIGAFLPFEQELGRALAHRAELGTGGRPVVARVALASAAVLAVLLVVGAVAAGPLVDRLFGGHWPLLFALAVTLAAMAAQYLTRGVYSGSGRFGWYSAQLGLEGSVRIAGCVALFALGVDDAPAYAWLLAAAPLASVLLTGSGALVSRDGRPAGLPGDRPRDARSAPMRSGPPAPWSEISANLGWLLLATLCAQGVANAAMVALQLLAPDGDAAGQFLAAFVIARVPLFLFQAVQAVLLPGLARALAGGNGLAFRRELRRVLAATGLVGLVGVLGAALVGPQVLRLAFGPDFTLGRADIIVLAAATGLYMIAQVFQSGLLALRRHRDNALGWAAALAVFALACLLPFSALARVELALVLSCALAAVLLAVRLVRAAAHNPPVHVGDDERGRA